ncbi:13439_t:CDS:2 [Ambispora gerdemannii]|uniref:Histidinol-phosphatase n=1 Tax=Ambispora gerdemannii TaxID=144530 RepID=A0A9N8WKX5_9GLOM|nr:13439_t:CDS:2 [Ambispora gerdemannii]
MPISMHSHSGQFCAHAKGNLEEVVQEAINKKFLIYGLSEHCPRYRVKDLYPEESHLHPSDLYKTFKEYVIEARRLQSKYNSEIKLIIGLESEAITINTASNEISKLVREFQLDYVVGSVHHVFEVPIDIDSETFERALEEAEVEGKKINYNNDGKSDDNNIKNSSDSREEILFSAYFDAQYKILCEIKPTIVGHFDVIRIFRPTWKFGTRVWEKVVRNVEFVVSYGGLFELNSSGWKKGLTDAYPQRDILELIIKKGGKFTISDDSHGPTSVGQNYDKLYKYLKEFQIDTIYYLDHEYDKDGKKLVVKKSLKNILSHPFWQQFISSADSR